MSVPKSPLYMPITTCTSCTVHAYPDDINETDNSFLMNLLQPLRPSTTTNDTTTPLVEVSSAQEGGKGIYCSNQHYGTPDQLLLSTSGMDMSDGWETARQPLRPKILQPSSLTTTTTTTSDGGDTVGDMMPLADFGNLMEYCILELGRPISYIERIVIDTKHFKGNYPESVELAGCSMTETQNNSSYVDGSTTSSTNVDWANDTFTEHGDDSAPKSIQWYPILERCRLSPHAIHVYDATQITFNVSHDRNPDISHIRVRIFPDGGLSRVRIYAKST
jgi:allantoicase